MENTIEVEKSLLDGKIGDSYSADLIAMAEGHKSKVRKPFNFKGQLWVSTGDMGTGREGVKEAECYRIVPRSAYTGATKVYWPAEEGQYEEWRNDPNGFYHGMLVWRGKEQWVLVGPETLFMAAKQAKPKAEVQAPVKPVQLRLFE